MYKKIFPLRIKDLRKKHELNQIDIATELGISVSKYNKLESGKLEPSLNDIGKLADYYDVPGGYIIGTKR